MIPQLNKYSLEFPHPNSASQEGIVAWGGDLTPSRLHRAYYNGIFPWFNEEDPILWWSPDPRFIMELDDFKISKSLKKSIKKFEYKFDTNFEQVVKNCATAPRKEQDGTWITTDMIEAYTTLYGMGIAHSVESYLDGKLVGGLYGVAIGGVFCGESMFSYVSDASKAAYATLVRHLKEWGYDFIDAQVATPHLERLGAKEIARELFLEKLYATRDKELNHLWKIC